MMLSVYLSLGGLMVLILVTIAVGILIVLVPRVRAYGTRILLTSTGAVMAVSGVISAMFARNPVNFWVGVFLTIMGSATLLQGIYAHNRRARGMIGGASIMI